MPVVRTERVAAAIGRAAEEVFARQRPDGAFVTPASASALATAGTITALHAADPEGSAKEIRRGAEWLRRNRLDDGGWGGVVGAPSDVTATAVAIAALRIADPAASGDAVAAGQRRLAELGGVASVADRTIAYLCDQFLALAGLPDGAPVRRLPLEIVLLDRVRRRLISFRTAPFVAMALMQTRVMPAGAVRRATARLAIPVALRLLNAIDEFEGHTGEFSADPWPTATICLGLARSGLAPGLVASMAAYLRGQANPDGSWSAVPNLDLTRSAFAATGLVAAGHAADPRLERTRELFHRSRHRRPFPVFGVPAGGWSYSGPYGWPVTLESAEILSALAGLPGAEEDAELRGGIDWLIGRQDRRGSWSLWVRDTRLPNDGPCPAITSQGITALLDAGHRPGDEPVRRAAAWLLTAGRPDGTYENLWYRDHTSGTAMVLDGLARAGHAGHPAAVRAREWLLRTQVADGSWGPGDGRAGSVEETAWAVHALLAAGVPAADEPIQRAIAWLLDAQHDDGSWTPGLICVYIRHYMYYPNGAITRGLALRALGAYRDAVAADAS